MSISLALLATLVGPARAVADQLFQLTEMLSEEEVRPRQATHVARWEGTYYVTDRDVTVRGWGKQGSSGPIAFDTPHSDTTLAGSPFTSVFHRLSNGLTVTVTYESYVLERQVEQTGPQTCRLHATMTLRPGHDLFAVRRNSNHEPMFDAWRRYTALRCTMPALVG